MAIISCWSKAELWKKMLLGMFLGILFGYVLSPHGLNIFSEAATKSITSWVSLPGAIFMALIKMIVIPLVVSSVTLAITSSKDLKSLRNTGIGAALYFVMTTVFAVALGIIITNIIKPGIYIPKEIIVSAEVSAETIGKLPVVETRPSLPEMLTSIIPTNPAKAVIDHSMLQIVIGSILMGIALLSIGALKAKPIVEFLQSVQDITMKIVEWAMAIAPFAVFSFLCAMTVKMGPDTIIAMTAYVGTVVLGLLLLLMFYLSLVFFIGRQSPLKFLSNIKNAQILAFSSSSSAATMPVTLKTAIDKLKLSPKVSNFIIPLGTTINMDGTALYQITAALFLTQIFGIDLSIIEMVILSVTIVGASIGSPGSPGVGLVILSTILVNIGVSETGIALILGVDRILDMCRTTINVTGDLTACTVIDKIQKNKKTTQ